MSLDSILTQHNPLMLQTSHGHHRVSASQASCPAWGRWEEERAARGTNLPQIPKLILKLGGIVNREQKATTARDIQHSRQGWNDKSCGSSWLNGKSLHLLKQKSPTKVSHSPRKLHAAHSMCTKGNPLGFLPHWSSPSSKVNLNSNTLFPKTENQADQFVFH